MIKNAKKTKGSAQPIDEYVGQKLRVRRSLLGMSQERLAEQTGITFQQIQKYERGKNRVSSSRLFQFSQILDVPVNYFFPQDQQVQSGYGMADNDQEGFGSDDSSEPDIMSRKETIKLVRSYYEITDPKLRQSILNHIKTLANLSEK